jgi:hypothetical protein
MTSSPDRQALVRRYFAAASAPGPLRTAGSGAGGPGYVLSGSIELHHCVRARSSDGSEVDQQVLRRDLLTCRWGEDDLARGLEQNQTEPPTRSSSEEAVLTRLSESTIRRPARHHRQRALACVFQEQGIDALAAILPVSAA